MSVFYINVIDMLIYQDRYSSKFCSKKRPLVKIPKKIHVKVCEGNRAELYSCTFNSSRQNPLDYLLSRENHIKNCLSWLVK